MQYVKSQQEHPVINKQSMPSSFSARDRLENVLFIRKER